MSLRLVEPLIEPTEPLIAPSKLCTKHKQCGGTMTWNPLFRYLGTLKSPNIYRPAWVCGKCGRHDYVKGT